MLAELIISAPSEVQLSPAITALQPFASNDLWAEVAEPVSGITFHQTTLYCFSLKK